MVITALGLGGGVLVLMDQLMMSIEVHGTAFMVLFFSGVFGAIALGLVMGLAFLAWAKTLAVLLENRSLLLAMARRMGG
jgi:hypothetical protein